MAVKYSLSSPFRFALFHLSFWVFWCLLLPIQGGLKAAEDSPVCAKVKIEIKQELTLERQAFDAHMRINNGLTHVTLEDVSVNVSFTDEQGNVVAADSDPNNIDALFFIRLDSIENVDNVEGAGTVAPLTQLHGRLGQNGQYLSISDDGI